jgi:hypothetical protein
LEKRRRKIEESVNTKRNDSAKSNSTKIRRKFIKIELTSSKPNQNFQQNQLKFQFDLIQNPRVSNQVPNRRTTVKGSQICERIERLGFEHFPEIKRRRENQSVPSSFSLSPISTR